MQVRKELKGRVKFVDDVTHRNMELIKRLERSQRFDQVWYFNCGIYGRTENGLQTKFQMYEDIITLLFTSLLNKHTIKGLGSCSAGSLCIDTTSLSTKVTFRSRLTKSIKS
jgi:hypothetical protein